SRLHRACDRHVAARHARCFALWRGIDTSALRDAATVGLPRHGYGPPDIASAYQLDTTQGSGQTIGIVDAYDNPNVEKDLAAYRSAWGLPPCTTANRCFEKVNQRGDA